MAVQDDLATLFAKNLTLSHHHQQQQPAQPQPEDPSNKIVYISQHYTHTAHVVQPVQRPSSEPDLADLEHVLRAHGVDTAALSLPQVELFRRADDAQKARLVQLWTICPPNPAGNTAADFNGSNNIHSSLTWSATSVEQEEMLARRRWEEAQHQQQQQPPSMPVTEIVMSLDGTETETVSSSPSSVQSPDGRWPVPATAVVAHAHSYMEPYMQSGYEELARREYEASGGGVSPRKEALDPVYKTTGMLDWERQQWMENQYGSFVGAWRDDEDML